jgi:hypothetical protein
MNGMPSTSFPFLYNPHYSAQMKKLLAGYFKAVKKIDIRVQRQIRKVYVNYFKIITPHKIDLVKFNFNINKIIHTEESIDAAKKLYKEIVSIFLGF